MLANFWPSFNSLAHDHCPKLFVDHFSSTDSFSLENFALELGSNHVFDFFSNDNQEVKRRSFYAHAFLAFIFLFWYLSHVTLFCSSFKLMKENISNPLQAEAKTIQENLV